MRSIQSTVQQWLQLQCQMIAQVELGVCLRATDVRSEELLCKWPQQVALPTELGDLIKRCLGKNNLQLAKLGSDTTLLARPVKIDGSTWGVLALALKNRSRAGLEAAIKLLNWGNTWLELLLTLREEDQNAELLQLLGSTLTQKTLDESAIAAVNKLASRLGCEQVALGLVRGKRMELEAISHRANFDPRTRQMQTLLDAMLEACEQRRDIHVSQHSGEPTAAGDIIDSNHRTLLEANKRKAVHSFLLRKGERIIGCITIEDSSERPLTDSARRFLEQCGQIMAQIFHIKLQADSGTLARLRHQWLRFFQRHLGPSHLRGKLTAIALGLITLVCLIPADYWVYADASLESETKRVLVAPQDGYLKAVHVRPGAAVEQGQLLAELDDRDLRLERRKYSSELQQFSQEYDEALANYDRAKAAILGAQIEQARAQLELTEQQLGRTRLIAPSAGIITSDDISDKLGAPLQQGEVLFEVASGDRYRVRLYVDEREVAALARAQTGRLILTSMPAERFDFEVSEITPLSEVRDGRNVFVVEGALGATDKLTLLRPGMTGSGKVLAGKRALGWIWFHDVIDAVRLALWL